MQQFVDFAAYSFVAKLLGFKYNTTDFVNRIVMYIRVGYQEGFSGKDYCFTLSPSPKNVWNKKKLE